MPPPPAPAAQNARGIVYWDKNNNGVYDKNDWGIENVAVSNGKDIVLTDKAGRYSIPADDNCIIFVIKPSYWISATDKNNFLQFYYINKPQGSPALKYPGIPPTGPLPKEINFAFYINKEGNQNDKMILLGDVQVRNIQEIEYFGKSFVPELSSSGASYVCTLGDNAFNDLSVYPALKDTLGIIGKPVFCLPGNHDVNFDVPTDEGSSESYKASFGPNYYSFNWGGWHIIMLDDVNYLGKEESYNAGLGKKQMDFLQTDLRMTSPSTGVIVMAHIPLTKLPKEEKDILYKELARFQTKFIVSGHTHSQAYEYLGKEDGWMEPQPLFHLNEGTACGTFWSGIPDEFGIPISLMNDGTPKGYAIIDFSGNYKITYKVPNRPANYQMNIYVPTVIAAPDLAKTDVLVNIFTGSTFTKAAMYIDNQRLAIPMEKVVVKDPGVIKQLEFEKSLNTKLFESNEWIKDCSHMWKATLPAYLTPGAHTLEIDAGILEGKTVFWVK
jgi:predicted phosphodiesterase